MSRLKSLLFSGKRVESKLNQIQSNWCVANLWDAYCLLLAFRSVCDEIGPNILFKFNEIPNVLIKFNEISVEMMDLWFLIEFRCVCRQCVCARCRFLSSQSVCGMWSCGRQCEFLVIPSMMIDHPCHLSLCLVFSLIPCACVRVCVCVSCFFGALHVCACGVSVLRKYTLKEAESNKYIFYSKDY